MSMIEYPNQCIAEAGECDVCGTKMPAGWWVVPLDDDLVACSSSCVGASRPPGEASEIDDLRDKAEELINEAEDLRETAGRLEWDAERYSRKADEIVRQVKRTRRLIPITGNIHNYCKD